MQEHEGGSALHHAVQNLKEDVVKLLLVKGAVPACDYQSMHDEGNLLLKKCIAGGDVTFYEN
jgi:hypothetical protein